MERYFISLDDPAYPEVYKDIDLVMADQRDLVDVRHTLRQVFTYKG